MRYIALALLSMIIATNTIAKDETIMLVGFEMPPFISADLPEKGFFPFLLNRVMADSQWAVQVDLLPIRRAIVSVDSGDHDGYLMAPVNSASQRHTFTTALINSKVAFYGLDSLENSYTGPESLTGKRVVEMNGWGSSSAFPDMNWVSVDDPKQMALMLQANRVQAFIYEDLSFQYLALSLNNEGKSSIVRLRPILFDIGYGIGFRGTLGASLLKFEALNGKIEHFVDKNDVIALFDEYLKLVEVESN